MEKQYQWLESFKYAELFRKGNLRLYPITLDKNIDLLTASIDDYWLSRYREEEPRNQGGSLNQPLICFLNCLPGLAEIGEKGRLRWVDRGRSEIFDGCRSH